MEKKQEIPRQENTREIDVIAVIVRTFKAPISLLVFLILFGALGVYIALTTPKTYSSAAVLAPEISGSSGMSGSLSDIASSFGIDLGGARGGMDAIYPEIYPDVLSSKDFLLKLLDVPVRLKDNDTIRTYFNHLQKDTESSIPEKFKAWLAKKLNKEEFTSGRRKGLGGEDDNFVIPKLHSEICEALAKNITCNVDKKTSVISISISDQDPLVAAIMVDTIQNRLKNYIIDYRTRKSKRDFQYYHTLFLEAKDKYEESRQEYEKFCDANQDLEQPSLITERDALEDKMQNTYNVMHQLQIQTQTAEAKIREITPAFTIVENPRMAYKASSTPRSLIALGYLFFGFFLDVLWANWRYSKKKNKKKAKTEKNVTDNETESFEERKTAEEAETFEGTETTEEIKKNAE